MKKVFLAIFTTFIAAGVMNAQDQRRATITGGGGNYGKCTITVVVDGAAEVDIHGDTAALRDLSGQPPQWRNFQCTSPMPLNTANVRFSAVEGRGRQQLIADPRNGGTARVRIEDSEGGASPYTFEVAWGGSNQDRRDHFEGYGQDDRVRGGSPNDQAIQACQDRIRGQAAERMNIRDTRFRNANVQDNPGGRDMVSGIFEVRRDYGVDRYRYSCSMRLESGRVFSADIEPVR